MVKIKTTKHKHLVAIKKGNKRELFSFPTKRSADSFVRIARKNKFTVIRSKL